MRKSTMFSKAVGFFNILIFILALASVMYSQNYQRTGDRLDIISRWIQLAYPELTTQQGIATLEANFIDGKIDGATRFELHPCTLHLSGVSPEQSKSLRCEDVTSSKDVFIELSINFGSNSKRTIPLDLVASGSFVDGKLNAIRERFGNRVHFDIDMHDKKRYWTDADLINAIEAGHPKYGPDQKPAFSMSLPIKGFEALTECELNPETLQFITTQPGVSSPVGEWQIKGKVRSSTSTSVANCDAEFEPFEGHLTSFHEL